MRAAASQVHFCPQLLPAVRARLGTAAGASTDALSDAARLLPLITAGDDRRVRVWSVEGVAGRGRRSGTRGAAGGALDGKRQKRAAGGGADNDDEDDDEEAVFGEPGFRAVASAKLRHKPNGVAGAADATGQRALVCVATCADDGLVQVLKV